LNECSGVIVLSKTQKKLLQGIGIHNRFFCFPASTRIERFKGKRKKRKKSNETRLLYLSSSIELLELLPFLEKLKQMNDVKLFLTANESSKQKNFLDSMNLSKKIEFIGKVNPKKRFSVVPEFDAGIYLRKFGQPIGNASTFMKVSEYMAASLPVIGPRISGLEEQVGENLVCFEEKSPQEFERTLFDKNLMKEIGQQNRKKAEKELDLKKNLERLSAFLEEVMQGD
jgi:glycosyltransferase involved in cell wall biosynthesis